MVSPSTTHSPNHGSKTEADLPAEATAVLTASRALLGVVARSLAPALETVSLAQFRVLVILSAAGAPMRAGALADAVGVHQSTFTRTADRLVTAELIRRVDNPDNRRETLIEPTTKGRRLVSLVTARRRTEITRVLHRMDPAERAQARAGFEAFNRAAGEPSPDDLAVLGM